LFWDKKAPTYPLPFESEPLSFTKGVMEIIEARCLRIEGAKVLDVGCGTGTFSLPLALRGASVTALDFSTNMLGHLTAEAQRLDIHGVKTVRASWKRIVPQTANLLGYFDIVLSALSIAVETTKDILKMEGCSKEWCVCIASGKIRRDSLFEEVVRAFRAPLNPRPDIRRIRDKLENLGRTFSYESFAATEREKKTPVQLTEEVARRLEASGRIPDRLRILTKICALYGCAEEDRAIEQELSTDMGILLWRAEKKQS
jgi:SAM-dependent methyltransferase